MTRSLRGSKKDFAISEAVTLDGAQRLALPLYTRLTHSRHSSQLTNQPVRFSSLTFHFLSRERAFPTMMINNFTILFWYLLC